MWVWPGDTDTVMHSYLVFDPEGGGGEEGGGGLSLGQMMVTVTTIISSLSRI